MQRLQPWSRAVPAAKGLRAPAGAPPRTRQGPGSDVPEVGLARGLLFRGSDGCCLFIVLGGAAPHRRQRLPAAMSPLSSLPQAAGARHCRRGQAPRSAPVAAHIRSTRCVRWLEMAPRPAGSHETRRPRRSWAPTPTRSARRHRGSTTRLLRAQGGLARGAASHRDTHPGHQPPPTCPPEPSSSALQPPAPAQEPSPAQPRAGLCPPRAPAGKAAACSAGIPYGCLFESRLLHFRSSSLLWPGKAVEDGPSPWAPAPTWETWKKLLAPDRLSSSRCGHLGSKPADGRPLSLCLSLCLSVTLPFK
nr:myeloid-associated differentiation marker-like protein 2 isoform X2 [Oryctolagus cuniculus]